VSGFRPIDGGVAVRLRSWERRLVGLAADLLDGLEPDDPAATRLHYVAHADDPDAEERFHDLTAGMLEEARASDRAAVRATLAAATLTGEEAESWLRVVGEARLVLAGRADVREDGWEEHGAPPGKAAEWALLHGLGYVQDRLVAALDG
jgi:hypothetical protein